MAGTLAANPEKAKSKYARPLSGGDAAERELSLFKTNKSGYPLKSENVIIVSIQDDLAEAGGLNSEHTPDKSFFGAARFAAGFAPAAGVHSTRKDNHRD
jgi:hypothetical protein